MEPPKVYTIPLKICRVCGCTFYGGDRKRTLEEGDIVEIVQSTIKACSQCAIADPNDKRIVRK